MNSNDTITLRNKSTGEIRVVPKSQFNSDDSSKGLSGIASDIGNSLSTLPSAAADMVSSIPGGISNVLKYATSNNPVSTMGNIGAGATESGAALLSSPQVLMRYLADKFPAVKQFAQRGQVPGSDSLSDPTIYESLMNLEKNKGLSPQSDQEATVRNLGGLLLGGKAFSSLPNMLSRAGTLAAQQAGAGGDPVHAAVLSMLGEKALGSNIPSKALNIAKGIPQAVSKIPNAVSKIPELTGKGLSSALESAADYGSQIPVAGSVLQPTVGALASYLKHISVAPEELAKRNLFGDIDPADISGMVERDAAGKRLGLNYLTPSELLDSPFESVKQANVGRTTPGMKLLYKAGKDRESSEGSAINKLFDLIHEDKLDPVKKAAYEETMQSSLPDDFVEKHAARPVIQKAMKAVENNTAYKQMLQEEYGVEPENVAKNSFMYWDMVKRVLGDMEQKLSRKGSNTEASVYGNTRRTMVSDMDKIQPQYKVARNIAERKFTRDELEKVFDKKDKTFNNFDSYLKSKDNFDSMMQKLDAFPEAKQQLQDIKLFSGNMIPNNPTVRAAAALKRTGMSDARNALEAKKREFDEKYGQAHDIAAVKQMTHPDLMEHLMKYLKQKGK